MPLDLSFREFLKNKLNFGIYYINFRPYQIQTVNIHFKEKTLKIFYGGMKPHYFCLKGVWKPLKFWEEGMNTPCQKNFKNTAWINIIVYTKD